MLPTASTPVMLPPYAADNHLDAVNRRAFTQRAAGLMGVPMAIISRDASAFNELVMVEKLLFN